MQTNFPKMIFSDKVLSQKLERAEGRANANFVETRARLFPKSGATWIDVCGAYAMFDTVESPCTQTFGLGLFDEIGDREMDAIEAFLLERGAPVFHEVSPLADSSLIPLLNERGYRPIEVSSVMYMDLDGRGPDAPQNPRISTRVNKAGEVDLWARTSASGWGTEHEGLAEFMFNFSQISVQCAGSFPFLAELDGKAIATGMLFIHEGVAMLAGASTIPEARNNGAQNALLDARLRFAAGQGCTLATMATLPGSQSQNNAQKSGFNVAYTRTKWRLAG